MRKRIFYFSNTEFNSYKLVTVLVYIYKTRVELRRWLLIVRGKKIALRR